MSCDPLLQVAVGPGAVDDDRLAACRNQALLLEHFQHASRHLSGTPDEARQFLAAHLDLHPVRVRHRVGLVTEIHDGVSDATRYVDECQVAQLAIGAIETRCELRCEFEYQPGAFAGDLPETRIGWAITILATSAAEMVNPDSAPIEQ